MTGAYIRKFSLNKKHIISAVFLIIALVLFIMGAYRALRIADCSELTSISNESDISKNDAIVFKAEHIKGTLKEAVNERAISCAQVSKGIISDYEILIINVSQKYRFLAIEKDSEEYSRLMNGEEVTGYFSDKYSNDFLDYVSRMDKYYKEEYVIPLDECSDKGIIVVDRKEETFSFLWGLPFLAIGLFILKMAGSPFFYMPENTPDSGM